MNHHGTMAFLRAALSHQRSIRLDLRQGRPARHRQQRRNSRARRHHGGVPDWRRLRAGQLLASGRCPAGQEGPALRRPQRHRRRDLVALLLPRTQVRPRLQSRTDRQAQRRLRRHPRHHPNGIIVLPIIANKPTYPTPAAILICVSSTETSSASTDNIS